ncbi:hypothetical protein VPH35_111021 [Triticum aestivum]
MHRWLPTAGRGLPALVACSHPCSPSLILHLTAGAIFLPRASFLAKKKSRSSCISVCLNTYSLLYLFPCRQSTVGSGGIEWIGYLPKALSRLPAGRPSASTALSHRSPQLWRRARPRFRLLPPQDRLLLLIRPRARARSWNCL